MSAPTARGPEDMPACAQMIFDRGSMAKSSMTAASSEWACRYRFRCTAISVMRASSGVRMSLPWMWNSPIPRCTPLASRCSRYAMMAGSFHHLLMSSRVRYGRRIGITLVELEGAVVGRAGHEGAADPRLIEDGEDLVRRVRGPVGPAVVDMAVEERRLRAPGGGAEIGR